MTKVTCACRRVVQPHKLAPRRPCRSGCNPFLRATRHGAASHIGPRFTSDANPFGNGAQPRARSRAPHRNSTEPRTSDASGGQAATSRQPRFPSRHESRIARPASRQHLVASRRRGTTQAVRQPGDPALRAPAALGRRRRVDARGDRADVEHQVSIGQRIRPFGSSSSVAAARRSPPELEQVAAVERAQPPRTGLRGRAQTLAHVGG